MIIAGNITPIDVITHIPILCEEADVPYIFVARKEELGKCGKGKTKTSFRSFGVLTVRVLAGAASGTKRPTSCILVEEKDGAEHMEYFAEVKTKVLAVQVAY